MKNIILTLGGVGKEGTYSHKRRRKKGKKTKEILGPPEKMT